MYFRLGQQKIFNICPFEFCPENKDNNYCIFADVVKGADTFRIYNVHLQSIKFQKDDYFHRVFYYKLLNL